MSEIWNRLGKSKLQHLVGENILDRLSKLLPALRPREIDADRIYTNEAMSKIFTAFSGPAALEKPDFRKDVFNALPEPLIDRLVKETGTGSVDLSFKQKVDMLVRKGWKSGRFAEKVVQELGLPSEFVPTEVSLPQTQTVISTATTPKPDFAQGQ